MRKLLLLTFIVFAGTCKAQSDSMDIANTIHRFFNALREGNSSEMEILLHDSLQLCTSYSTPNGEAKIHFESRDQFIQTIRTKGNEAWDEQISNLEIRSSKDIGSAWMDYRFYHEEEFSHCGINSFQLVRQDHIWRIICIFDTRDRSNCD